MKLKETLEAQGMRQKELARRLGIPKPKMSDIANGKLLPTVPMLRQICAILDREPLELYSREELDLIHCTAPRSRRKETRRPSRRMGFRLYSEVITAIPEDFLAWRGCRTWQDWFAGHLSRDLRAYEKKKARGTTPAPAEGDRDA